MELFMSKLQAVKDHIQGAKAKAEAKIKETSNMVVAKVEHIAIDALDKGIALSEKQVAALKSVRSRNS
jgi:hypothetical protein